MDGAAPIHDTDRRARACVYICRSTRLYNHDDCPRAGRLDGGRTPEPASYLGRRRDVYYTHMSLCRGYIRRNVKTFGQLHSIVHSVSYFRFRSPKHNGLIYRISLWVYSFVRLPPSRGARVPSRPSPDTGTGNRRENRRVLTRRRRRAQYPWGRRSGLISQTRATADGRSVSRGPHRAHIEFTEFTSS